MPERLDVFEVRQQRWRCVHSALTVGTEHKLELLGDLYGGTREHSAVIARDKLLVLGGRGYQFRHLRMQYAAFAFDPFPLTY